MRASDEGRGASGEAKSTYRLSRGVAFWGVLSPLTLAAFLMVCLMAALMM